MILLTQCQGKNAAFNEREDKLPNSDYECAIRITKKVLAEESAAIERDIEFCLSFGEHNGIISVINTPQRRKDNGSKIQ
jgi:hypothetical protein